MSIPCGMVAGLPVGLMLVGQHLNEPLIYQAAQAFEKKWRLEELLGFRSPI